MIQQEKGRYEMTKQCAAYVTKKQKHQAAGKTTEEDWEEKAIIALVMALVARRPSG